MELSERDLELRAEYRRELDEQFKRKRRYKNGAEALEALRDLFESEEELEEVRTVHPADAGGGGRPDRS